MARRRFQKGQLFKSGKRRKMWVGRWREDVLLEGGTIGQVRRWHVLGSVAEYPTRREARAMLDERLRAVNAGASRPESSIAFGTFVEEQWKALVLPTFKASTQHGYKTVVNVHVGQAAQGHRAPRDSAMGCGQVPSAGRVAGGAQRLGALVQHSRNGGGIRVSPIESGAGRDVPAEGAEGETRHHQRRESGEATQGAG